MKTYPIFSPFIGLGLLLTITYGSLPAMAADTVSNAKGKWIIYVNPSGGPNLRDTISIIFKPDSAATNCGKIEMIQTLKTTFYDAAGNGTVVNIGSLSPAFKQMEDDVHTDTTVVDNIYCERDPYCTGDDTQDWTGTTGSSAGDGSATTASTFWDPPNIPDRLFPANAVKVIIEFEICAYCTSGVDLNTCYGCIKWKYERNKGGGMGTCSFIPGGPSAPSASHTAAVDSFKNHHTTANGASYCPEQRGDSLAQSLAKIFEDWNPFFMIAQHPYQVLYSTAGVTQGIAIPGSTLPANPIGSFINPGEFVFVPAGAKLGLTRVGFQPMTDPSIPFQASFNDVFYGRVEMQEKGAQAGPMHQGIRVKNCSGTTLCAAAPVNTTNPNANVIFTTRIDNLAQKVVFTNSPLSNSGLNCKNVLSTAAAVIINPGDSVSYNYPGMLPACASTLNLKLFIQGYATGSNMVPVLQNQGEDTQTGNCDSLLVDLHNPFPPFQTIHSTKAILKQDGTLTCNFPGLMGQFFIGVRHRNAIETWSAMPVQFNNGQANYDFSNTQSKAYGNNQVMVAPGIYAFFSGDVNHDQSIDLLDMPEVENDAVNFAYGYKNSDLNGDGSTDLLDASILELNINNFIFAIIPN